MYQYRKNKRRLRKNEEVSHSGCFGCSYWIDETLLQDVEHYNKEEARRDLGLESGRILLYVGRMVANKRPIEALRLLKKWRMRTLHCSLS